jgi:hypothetical protein
VRASCLTIPGVNSSVRTGPRSEVDEASINFGGMQIVDYRFSVAVKGNIDRVTGRMDATTVLFDPTKLPDPNTATIRYDVVCRAI